MAPLEQIQLLIAELGPATEEVAEIQQHGDSSWEVFFDEETAVGIDVMEGQNKLMLSIDLGSPPDDCKITTFQCLLVYNYAWESTGGVKMGLEAPDGAIQMMFEINSADLDLMTLQNVLVQFSEKARVWRGLITAGIRENEPVHFDEIDLAQAIRV